jgi:hypothetical protein
LVVEALEVAEEALMEVAAVEDLGRHVMMTMTCGLQRISLNGV